MIHRPYLLAITLFAVLLTALSAVSLAQVLDPPLIEELEEGIEQAEQERAERLEQERVERERAEQNQARWREFTRYRDEIRFDTRSMVRRGEAARLLHDLEERGRIWRMGLIYYHLGDDRAAATYAGSSFNREEHEWAVREGHTQTLLSRAQLLSEFDGEDWDERTERSITRRIESVRTFLERSLNEPQQRRREQRSRTYEQFTEWLDGYVAAAGLSAEQLHAIEQDTWNAQAIWELAGTYRDGLVNYMRAHEWLSVLKHFFPESDLVRSGRVDARIAEGLVRMGLISEAQGYLASAENSLNAALDRAVEARQALLEQIQNGEVRREELTREQRQLLNANIDELRGTLGRVLRESRERVEEYAGYILRDAGRE